MVRSTYKKGPYGPDGKAIHLQITGLLNNSHFREECQDK